MQENTIKELLLKPPIKALIISGLTTLLTVWASYVFSEDKEANFYFYHIVLLILLCFLYISYMVWSTAKEVNERKSFGVLKNRVDAFENMMINFIAICQTNATDVNKCIKKAIDNNQIDLNLWNFDEACKFVCDSIFNTVSLIGNSREYGIFYVKLIEKDLQDHVQMVAYANQNRHTPTIYRKKRKFKKIVSNNSLNLLWYSRPFGYCFHSAQIEL